MATKNLWDLISESKLIIKAHPRHFLTLTLIFLFPLSFSVLLSPTLSNLFNNFLNLQQQTTDSTSLLYSLITLILSNSGVISITYSVFHFSCGQPASLRSAIKSISTSFVPLFGTTLVSQVILFLILFFYGLLLVLAIHVVSLFDVTVSYSSPYFLAFFVALPLLLVLVYFQVNYWTLVPVIVVVESCWGLEPLRRSARLIKGMKGVALSSFFLYGFLEGLFLWNCIFVTTGYDGMTENWVTVVRNWVMIVLYSYLVAMAMLTNIAVNTVLYISCKANHGEIVEEFGKDYVSLPFHDGNVSQAV